MKNIGLWACCLLLAGTLQANQDVPKYKPWSRAPAAIDITSNGYGFSKTAPNALKIGEQAPNFTLPGPRGSVSLEQLSQANEVVIIFYRGHW